jgi:hypothetical protein
MACRGGAVFDPAHYTLWKIESNRFINEKSPVSRRACQGGENTLAQGTGKQVSHIFRTFILTEQGRNQPKVKHRYNVHQFETLTFPSH